MEESVDDATVRITTAAPTLTIISGESTRTKVVGLLSVSSKLQADITPTLVQEYTEVPSEHEGSFISTICPKKEVSLERQTHTP